MKKAFGVCFMAILLLVPALYFILPQQTYSALEKRYLADGIFPDTESYLTDHMPARETLVMLNSARTLASGLQINNDVYWDNGTLNEAPMTENQEQLAKNLDRIASLGQALGQKAALLPVPGAGAVRAQRGGQSLRAYPDEALLTALTQDERFTVLSLFDAFASTEADPYYATDPHWNGGGAYLAYQALGDALGYAPLPKDAFTVTAYAPFYGTCYARSGLWMFPPDTLQTWDSGADVTVTYDGGTVGAMFELSHAGEPDLYPIFFDGNHGLTVIQNNNAQTKKRLLLLKDSFGNSLAPLLCNHYAEIVMVDMRAYRQKVSDLAPFDDILVVYSLSRLSHDVNLSLLK